MGLALLSQLEYAISSREEVEEGASQKAISLPEPVCKAELAFCMPVISDPKQILLCQNLGRNLKRIE